MAASREGSGPGAIWAIDLSRDAPTRITEGMRPVASPDGTEVAFTSDQETGVADIYLRPLDSAEGNELLVRSAENKMVDDWTRDGSTVVFASTNGTTKADIWMVPLAGDREPRLFLRTPFNEFQSRLSPDGRWIAYASDEAGAYEVYLQSFPTPGDKITVSVGGGTEPRWREDGRELFYLAPDGAVMAVSAQPGPRAVRLGRPEKLFRVPQLRARGLYINNYDVSDDGQRFLMTAPQTSGHPSPLTLIVNWPALTTTR